GVLSGVPLPATAFPQRLDARHIASATRFTSSGGLASVSLRRVAKFGNCTHSRFAFHPAAQSGSGVVHFGVARAVEYLPPRAVHGRARRRSKTKIDAVYGSRFDRR